MTFNFGYIMIAMLVWQTVYITFSVRKRPKRIPLVFLGSLFLLYGIIGFFGSFGFYDNLIPPETFEWPVGTSRKVVELDDGSLVVPLVPSGRIQIYTSEKKFVRGLKVKSSGGDFKVIVNDAGDGFNVYTARNSKLYQYDRDGNITSESASSRFSKVKTARRRESFPFPFYLFVMVHPFIGWFFFAGGLLTHMLAYGMLEQIRRKMKGEKRDK